MIIANDISLRFGDRILFENVNIKFTPGNCYGLIGANGSGKSTFLKILSGEIEANRGSIAVGANNRVAVLKQNHYEFDEYEVIKTVIMGHKRLCQIIDEKEELYKKVEFTEQEGIKISELELEFAEIGGWEAETEAAILLNGLGVNETLHNKQMNEIGANLKVKVLLAQALFGNPQILLLDEPTNHLDVVAITWLENFLYNFNNTVIVVSHDRHFLNKVCTHIADIDYNKIKIYTGNYDFWYKSSQLALQQAKDSNKKTEAKRKELEVFIQRFSANASKSKQATSRKKQLEKLTLEDIKPSSRRYPFIDFKFGREIGKDILSVNNINKKIDKTSKLNNVTFMVNKEDKIIFLGANESLKTTLFQILVEEIKEDSGSFKWGITTSQAYFPKDNNKYFENSELKLIDWIRQYSEDKSDTFVRGWLGRMLFSGEEALKKAQVISGGERVRCMLSKMMLESANILILDEPTNHLDLESITSLNNGLINFKGAILFTSHDHQFVQTIANRIIEITPNGIIDRKMKYDDYIINEEINILRKQMNN